MTNKPMLSIERGQFEAFWCKEMNVQEMDLHRCEFPMTATENQPYACHETERSWVTWKARALIIAQHQSGPAALPFAKKVISKLRRFEECAGDSQDVDIGRKWFDVLTHLGLLERVQRSPAFWEMTQQGEDALEVVRLNTPQ
ncbi:hypothetical protein [Pseudomonas psychrophila]|uniref:hypothetical protein n=1 Tax=Pseudomonas psychrophila TaxID=122355 RepID=UPI0003582F5A|nr:hypothetical protein [Pseudomonas psychrophila]EPJ90990.1 hypothetical protein CF149_23431 [Pseudomonas psychrophila]